MGLHDPATFARIVRGMINIQQHEGEHYESYLSGLPEVSFFLGWLPECRGATVKQFIQGGSSMYWVVKCATSTVDTSRFVKMETRSFRSSLSSKLSPCTSPVKDMKLNTTHRFQQQAEALSVPSDALYNALLADAELQPPNWDLQGRQANMWKSQGRLVFKSTDNSCAYALRAGYIPQDVWERSGTNSKQVSRTLEVSAILIFIVLGRGANCFRQYAFDDFTISQVAKALGRSSDGKKVLHGHCTSPMTLA